MHSTANRGIYWNIGKTKSKKDRGRFAKFGDSEPSPVFFTSLFSVSIKIILKCCNLFHFPCIIIVKDLSEPEKGGAMDKEKIDYINILKK